MTAITQSLIFLLVACTISDTADVPDGCYLINNGTHDECYTFSNNVYAIQPAAEKICVSSGGRLPIITDERTWDLLIAKFLKGSPNHVWLGYTVGPTTPKLIPTNDLSNLTKYFNPSSVTAPHLNYCMYGQHNTWVWLPYACNNNFAYICQYPMYCKISDIEDPQVRVETCVDNDYIRNNKTIEITCQPGYFLNTSDTLTCRRGKWEEKPECIPGCPPPGPRRNAILTSVKKYYDIDETIYYVCKNNYFYAENHQETHFSSTCRLDSSWTDTEARCSVRYPFSTTTIDISTVKTSQIVLNCKHKGVNITWTHDGRSIVNNMAYAVTSSGNLQIDSKSENIDGFYSCNGEVNGKIEIGAAIYEIVNRTQCYRVSTVNQVVGKIGQNLLLGCPVDYEDYHVKWYRDGLELIGTETHSVLPTGGLFLSSVSLRDEGLYQCLNIHKAKSNSCLYNITHKVSVIASVEEACGSTTTAEISNYQPWVVTIRQEGEAIPICYGTLLNENWVVTSGFCLACIHRMKKLEGIYLEAGPEGRRQKIPVASVIVHPKYQSRRSSNDIGLLQVQEFSIKFSKEIFPICLGPDDVGDVHKCELKADLNGTVGGWGSLVDGNGIKDFKTELMTLVPKKDCRKSVTFGFADDKFCAEFIGEKQSLASDDGSPFLVSIGGREHLLGIFTWGERHTGAKKFDYFTSIYYHYEWIKKIIQ